MVPWFLLSNSGDEDYGEDVEDDESVDMDHMDEGIESSDQFVADAPHEDYTENAKPLPIEGKGIRHLHVFEPASFVEWSGQP